MMIDINNFVQHLESTKSKIPPESPIEGSIYMNLDGAMFVFIDEKWEPVEALNFQDVEAVDDNFQEWDNAITKALYEKIEDSS
jgi:hypothetical protein